MAFSMKLKRGILMLSGQIDESAIFAPPPAGNDPVELNFRDIDGINSQGVKRFLGYLASLGSRKAVYHECTHPLVDAFVMLPAMLGAKTNVVTIASLQVPYGCAMCSLTTWSLIDAKEIFWKGTSLALPPRACSKCMRPISYDPTVAEIEVLAERGALTPSDP